MTTLIWPAVVALLTCCVPQPQSQPRPAVEAPLLTPPPAERHAAKKTPAHVPQVKPPVQAIDDALRSGHELRDAITRRDQPAPTSNLPDLP